MERPNSNSVHGEYFAYRILKSSEGEIAAEFKARTFAYGKTMQCLTQVLFTEDDLVKSIESLKANGEDSPLFEHALRDLRVFKK